MPTTNTQRPACDLPTLEERKQCACQTSGNCNNILYWYHSDHLGSSTYLTDAAGYAYQFALYLPFGESMADQKAAPYSTPYKFNGKELDQETGLYYYGARYYDPRISLWYGVDPLAEKYPNMSPYNYTFNNPINLTDPTGMEPDGEGIIVHGSNNSSFTIKTTAVNSEINLSDYGVSYDFGGNYSMELSDLKPDAIGIDLGGALTTPLGGFNLGVNLLWHTRGENCGDVAYPEVHTYAGGQWGFTPDATANAQVGLILAWATKKDGSHASDKFVANGVNWTGNFWGASVSIGEAQYAGGGSVYAGWNPTQKREGDAWAGITLAWTPQISATAGLGKLGKYLDQLKSGTLSGMLSKSHYWMIYGNGNDYLDFQNSNSKDDKNVSGWHIWNPIDPDDNPKK